MTPVFPFTGSGAAEIVVCAIFMICMICGGRFEYASATEEPKNPLEETD